MTQFIRIEKPYAVIREELRKEEDWDKEVRRTVISVHPTKEKAERTQIAFQAGAHAMPPDNERYTINYRVCKCDPITIHFKEMHNEWPETTSEKSEGPETDAARAGEG